MNENTIKMTSYSKVERDMIMSRSCFHLDDQFILIKWMMKTLNDWHSTSPPSASKVASSSQVASVSGPRERHDPTDTEVSGEKWAVVAYEAAETAVFRNTLKNVIALTLTRA